MEIGTTQKGFASVEMNKLKKLNQKDLKILKLIFSADLPIAIKLRTESIGYIGLLKSKHPFLCIMTVLIVRSL